MPSLGHSTPLVIEQTSGMVLRVNNYYIYKIYIKFIKIEEQFHRNVL